MDIDIASKRVKSKVYEILCPILALIGIDANSDGLLGGHSARKFSSTWTRRNGVAKDDKDHRGRWKRKRVSDTYDNIQLDYIDAKVASVLCPSGVCAYIVDDPACTGDWIVSNVTPSIGQVFGRQLVIVFGKAILWLACSEHKELIPVAMCERITTAHANLLGPNNTAVYHSADSR